MNEPIFQDFTKEVINPFSTSPTDVQNSVVYKINKEEENIEQLIIRRNKENMNFRIFTILCKKDFNYSNIINFIKEIMNTYSSCTKGDLEEITIDVTSKFDNNFSKNKTYLINLHNEKNNYSIYPEAFSLFIMNLFKNSNGIVFISDKIENLPQLALTLSELVFVENTPDYSNNIQEIFSRSCFYKLRQSVIDNLDMICVDKLSLWTKIRNFSKY